MSLLADAPVNEALIADMYIRIERAEGEIRQLKRMTPSPNVMTARTALTEAIDALDAAESSETRPLISASSATPPHIPWPAKHTEFANSAPATPIELLRVAFNLCPDAAVGFDADGTVRIWNAAATALFGWTADEVIGALPPFLPSDRVEEHASLVRYPRSVFPGQDLATVRRCKEGLLISVRAKVNESPCGGVVFTYREVPPTTDHVSDPRPAMPSPPPRRSTPSTHIEVDASTQHLITLGKAVSGVAHDFNNMLSVIHGYGELLAERLPIDDPLRGVAETIVSTADLGGSVSRHLMGLVHPENGTPAQTDINHILNRVEKLLKSVVGAQIKIGVTLAPRLPMAQVHPAELFQVVLNLLTNARDAIDSTSGMVTIRTATQTIPFNRTGWPTDVRPGDFVVLTVTDTGHGMDSQSLQQLFDPGFTTRQSRHSPGIGLRIVKDILTRAGGHIEVESDPKWGTTIRLYFRKA